MEHTLLTKYITFEMRSHSTTVPTTSVRSWIRFVQLVPQQRTPHIDLDLQSIVNRHPHQVPKDVLYTHVVTWMAPAPPDTLLPTAGPQTAPQSDKCH